MSAIATTLPTLTAAGQSIPGAVPPVEPATAPRVAWLKASRRSIPAPRTVAAVDAVVLTAALLSTGTASWPAGLDGLLTLKVAIADLATLGAFALAVPAIFEIAGLYEAGLVRRWRDELQRLLGATGAVAVGTALAAAAGPASIAWPPALDFWLVAFAGVAVTRGLRSYVTRSTAGCRRVLVVGSGPHALRICRELSGDPLTTYQVVGFVDTSDGPRSAFVTRRTLGGFDALESILVREHIDEVHVGLPVKSRYHDIQTTIGTCERIGVKVFYGADIFGTALARPRIGTGTASPRVELRVVAEGPAVLVKRVLDICGASVLLLALAPLMLLTAFAVMATSDGPVIFAQERYGLNRRRFRMLKFRTMVQNAETLQASLEALNEFRGPMFKIARDPRITALGRWLRRTSIDELPQLFNVLRGEMSLIGPRPLPLRDVAHFARPDDMRRFSVRPGLTGLWQVSGRSNADAGRWIALDLHYIDNWSLLLDFRILARTPSAVIRGTGAA